AFPARPDRKKKRARMRRPWPRARWGANAAQQNGFWSRASDLSPIRVRPRPSVTRRQKTEDRRQKTEDGRHKTEDSRVGRAIWALLEVRWQQWISVVRTSGLRFRERTLTAKLLSGSPHGSVLSVRAWGDCQIAPGSSCLIKTTDRVADRSGRILPV